MLTETIRLLLRGWAAADCREHLQAELPRWHDQLRFMILVIIDILLFPRGAPLGRSACIVFSSLHNPAFVGVFNEI